MTQIPHITQISMKELHDRLPKLGEDELILDVRTPEEFAEGHVHGSRNIPYEEVDQAVDELKKFKAVYIYCRSGRRAQVARDTLLLKGLKNLVCIGDGGMLDWQAAGYELEK